MPLSNAEHKRNFKNKLKENHEKYREFKAKDREKKEPKKARKGKHDKKRQRKREGTTWNSQNPLCETTG